MTGEHIPLAVVAMVALIFYFVFVPGMYFYVLFVMLPRHGLEDKRFRVSFGFLYSRFEN